MKKIYFLLVMLSTICAFTACSDDDGDDAPTCPVTGYSVPETINAGNTLTITGTGYIASAKIILQNAQNKETQAENLQLVVNGITVTIPSSLAAGSYKVILRQAGDWELGKITVEAAGPIQDLIIPGSATAGDKITIAGIGFPENTNIYLESDDFTTDEVIVSDITATGLSITIPAIMPAGSYQVMLDQEDGIKLGMITISEKATPAVISRIIKIQEYGNDSIIFNYTNGKISSINFITYENKIYDIEYKADNSVEVTYVPSEDASGAPLTYNYILTDGRVTTSSLKTKEYDYDYDTGEETETDKTYSYSYEYNSGNYLLQINQTPDNDFGYDTLTFNYEQGKIQKFVITTTSPLKEEATAALDTKAVESFTLEYPFTYAKEINNTKGFDVMSVIMWQIGGRENEYLTRFLGIGGKYPAQLPTSYFQYGDKEINYTIVNGYITKIVFPEEYVEDTVTYRLEYQ